jgi:hypothetical protein
MARAMEGRNNDTRGARLHHYRRRHRAAGHSHTQEDSIMSKPWKVARAFQNNGPDYFVVTDGTWGAVKIQCLDERSAETVRDALAALERARNALEGLMATDRNGARYEPTYAHVIAAIAKAKGHE